MSLRAKGKWAQGIRPRNFAWVIKDRLAVCERPGGFGANHRRVRRQEEIIWLREQGFTCVVSIIPSPHNLHNYDELGVAYLHLPFGPNDDVAELISRFYPDLHERLRSGGKIVLHGEELSDRVAGLIGGYIRWSGLVPQDPQAIAITERLTSRQLDPFGRGMVALAGQIPGPGR
jgi:hypothetical protein